MRVRAGLLVALLVVLAGCSVGYQPDSGGPTAPTDVEPTPTDAAGSAETPAGESAPDDPASDVLGWEDGYWYNESLSMNQSDGLNESERRAFVARTMARVERVREWEFTDRVPITVVSRETYKERFASSRNRSRSFRAFDNAKFEAMFLVGEDNDSLAVQNQNRGSNVLGFYSPRNESIVIVSDAPTPRIDRGTLSHELVHALQDQHTDLLTQNQSTRERYNAVNGLVEGDANYVQQRYEERCGDEWDCVERPERGGGGGGSIHLGIYVLNYFPYSEGPWFVKHFRNRGGWDRVNRLYEAPPASTAQVIDPETYGAPAPTVNLTDDNGGEWERLRPESEVPRADYASLGPSGMTAMFAYTLYDDYNDSFVLNPRDFLNTEGRGVNRSRPFNYDTAPVSGWAGDRMHVYWRPDAEDPVNQSAYVWKSEWASAEDAEEFAAAYRDLLSHWGGTRVGDGTWRVRDSPYEDAFHVRVEGSTVVVVNAPTVDDLSQVDDGVGQ